MDRGTKSSLLAKPIGMSDKEWLDHLLGQQTAPQSRPAGMSDQEWLDHLLGQAQKADASNDATSAHASTEPQGGQSTAPLPEVGPSNDWLKAMLWPYRASYKQAVILSFGINILGLFAAIFSLQVYDRVVGHAAYSTLAALSIGMAIAIGMDHVFRAGRSLLLQRIGARIEVGIAHDVLHRMLNLPAGVLEKRGPGYWQAVYRDVEIVRTTCSGASALLLIDLPFMLLSLILIGFVALPLLPICLMTMACFAALAWRSGQVTRDATETEREVLVSRDTLLSELSATRMHLKAVGAADAIKSRWEEHYARWLNESVARSREADHYREVAHAMTTANSVITTSFGALAILSQYMTMGSLIATNILAGRLISPMVQLVSQWRSFGQFKAAKKRLDELFNQPLDRVESSLKLPRPSGVIRLEGVTFTYPGHTKAQLQPLSGEIGPHGLHAIVGHNGSGKTTLLKLIRGLYTPTQGRVLLDGADMHQYSQAELASHMGYLSQEVQLLAMSLRDNIALARPNASDDEIMRAAMRAQAHEFIIDLPDGYGTKVGQGGHRFSAGQAKRIAIAQSLLNDPPVMLLDEPTAELDRDSELRLIKVLKELAVDHTVVVVSHSPLLLSHCQGVLVLDKGKLVAAGPGAQILPKLGIQPATRPTPRHLEVAA